MIGVSMETAEGLAIKTEPAGWGEETYENELSEKPNSHPPAETRRGQVIPEAAASGDRTILPWGRACLGVSGSGVFAGLLGLPELPG